MKFTVNSAAFNGALAQVGKLAQGRPVIPALGCIQIEAHVDGGLTLTATDLETRAIKTIAADVQETGAVLLPKPMLLAFAAELQGGEATVSVNDAHRATITSGQAKIALAGMDVEEFPVGGNFDAPDAELTLAADVFAAALRSVIHAVAPDESRPVLSGVQMTVQGNTLTMAAADGHRLGVRYVRDLPDSGDLSVIVQGKPLAAMYATLKGCTSVRLAVNERQSHLLLDTEAGSWHLRLIEGQFPDFNRIIPQETPFTCLVDRTELLAAVKLVAPVAFDNSMITRLSAVDDVLTVSAAADNQSAETTVTIEPLRGGSMVWALNNKYLRDALDAIDDTRVTVNVAGPASPTVLHGDNRSVGVQVVMAMHEKR